MQHPGQQPLEPDQEPGQAGNPTPEASGSQTSATGQPARAPEPSGNGRPGPRPVELPPPSRRPGEGPSPETDPEHFETWELERAIERSRDHLLALQQADGHWCGELEGDTILESEYLLLLHFLGLSDTPRARKAAEYLRRQQGEDGGWAVYPGGPAEVSASVKAYLVLKIQGDDPDAPHMARARERILELGGVEAANTYTKTYLAIFGQYDWNRCPAIPPEIILLPRWFYFDIYEMSSWSRAIFVPLSIVWAHKPYRALPKGAEIPELYVDPDHHPGHPALNEDLPRRERHWQTFFFTVDKGLKLLERSRLRPLRRKALERAERWIRERLVASDGLGAIFPSIVNTIVAFRCLGYELDDPLVRGQLEELEALEIEEDGTLRLQPCLSPVWDTAQAATSLLAAGVAPDHPAIQQSAQWLLDREVRHPGDWQIRNPEVEPAGWYFEYANEFYPDCDDTAEVLTTLARIDLGGGEEAERAREARQRSLRWLLSMQNEDGGWAAFDKGCDKEILTLVPFADHNAMIDPSCEDITGRVLETLAVEGFERSDPIVRKAVAFLEERQLSDGTWYGRWGANYIYGTWLALWGLWKIGEDMSRERWQRAADWLEGCQNEDGGWGESLRSYEEPELKGRGDSTASQTAWALMGLMAAGRTGSEAVRRGISWLLENQSADGSWEDLSWTGTGFPKVFYLRYHYYDDYFPLLALATWRNLTEGDGTAESAHRPDRARLVATVHGG